MSTSPRESIEVALAQVQAHLTEGDAEAAFIGAQAAWQLAHASVSRADPLALSAARTLGICALESGRPEAARQAARLLLEVLEEDDPRRAFALADLGHAAMAEGDRPAAEAHLRAALETLEDLVDEPGVSVVPLLAALATLAAAREGGLEQARVDASRCLDVLIEHRGEAAVQVADTLVFCALLDLKSGAPRGASALLRRALQIYEVAGADEGRRAVAARLHAEARAMARGTKPEAVEVADPELDAALHRLAEDLGAALRSGPRPRRGARSPR